MRYFVLAITAVGGFWPVSTAAAASAAGVAADPVWLKAVDDLAWPAIVLVGLLLAASPMGSRLLGPVLQRIRGISVGAVKLDLTPEAATKVREDLQETFVAYRASIRDEFDRLARKYNISFLRSQVINKAVIPHLSPEVQRDFRCTIHVQDLLFKEALYQLLDYAPESSQVTRGRAFPIRFGILGKAWRSGESQVQGEVSTNPATLIVDWGMTSEEATAAGRGRQSFACIVLKDAEHAPLGVFYLDSMQSDAFGNSQDAENEFSDRIERAATDAGLTGALAKLVEDTRERGPEIEIFDQV